MSQRHWPAPRLTSVMVHLLLIHLWALDPNVQLHVGNSKRIKAFLDTRKREEWIKLTKSTRALLEGGTIFSEGHSHPSSDWANNFSLRMALIDKMVPQKRKFLVPAIT